MTRMVGRTRLTQIW